MKHALDSVSFKLDEEPEEGSIGYAISELRIDGEDRVSLDAPAIARLEATFDIRTWNQPYSVIELATTLERTLLEEASSLTFWPAPHRTIWNAFGVEFEVSGSKTAKEILDEVLPRLKQMLADAEQHLLLKSQSSVAVSFEFPDEIKPACEQYLLYFGQFLKDLGINADAEVREQAARVLFTITPTDRAQALDVIREALDAYLQIPGAPQARTHLATGSDIAILQLNANVLHLQSQVALAAAVIQAKDATIDAQLTEIDILKKSMDLRGFLPATNSISPVDSETLIEGVLAVKKVEHKGFELNLPEILRRLKRIRL